MRKEEAPKLTPEQAHLAAVLPRVPEASLYIERSSFGAPVVKAMMRDPGGNLHVVTATRSIALKAGWSWATDADFAEAKQLEAVRAVREAREAERSYAAALEAQEEQELADAAAPRGGPRN